MEDPHSENAHVVCELWTPHRDDVTQTVTQADSILSSV